MGEALSRLRPLATPDAAPVCALGAPQMALGDWRLTPLLLQRCLSYVGQRAGPQARLEVRAQPRRPGEALVLSFSAQGGRRTEGAQGAALLLALRDLARAHGWEAAPALEPVAGLRLTIPPALIVDPRDRARDALASPGAAE
jgi:hypothetical protein